MAEQLIDLKVIDPNPYQKRIASNREKVVGIAFSIATDKMLQVPTGRWVGKRFQSAIGHTRTESYRLNAQIQAASVNGKKYPEDVTLEHIEAVKAAITAGRDFATMPWIVEELSDEQMYRYATIENNQREDLSAIEKMEEMKGWVEFGYNSKQIAAMYPGMSDATVRGLLSFDKLPQEAKEALHEGKISQGTARTLLSMQRIAPKEKIAETIKKIEKQEGNTLPDEVIEEAIEHLDNTIDMWDERYRSGKPRAGYDGWPLDMKRFPNELLPKLTGHTAVQALDCFNDKPAQKLVLECAEHFYDIGNIKQGERLDELKKINPDYVAKLEHLLNPPACTVCPYFTKVRGSHICGVKACYTRKKEAWEVYSLQQTSKRLKISIYAESDGAFRVLDTYDHRKIFESRTQDLRLIPTSSINGHHYQHFDGMDDDICLVVATGSTIDKMKSESGSAGTGRGPKTEKEKAEMRMMRVYKVRRKEFLWAFTACAKSIFDAVPHEPLLKINGWNYIGVDQKPPENEMIPTNAKVDDAKLDFLRRLIVWRLCGGDDATDTYHRRDLTKISDGLEKLAKEWGVKYPKSLTTMAAQFQAEIEAAGKGVSTATAKKVAKK